MAAATAAAPTSPFSTLLRSSRFASYDPYIRQTYSSPLPAYSSRGNWGLKRPISLRRRNAFITLKKYEEHAQFVEWSHAESQVRFVRRVEGMNVLPKVVRGTGWAKGLGWGEEGVWGVDSEFGEAEWGEGVEAKEAGRVDAWKTKKVEKQLEQEQAVDLRNLGHKGRGSYSPKRLYSTNVQELIPNIDAMSPREFEKFLTKLRGFRGEFGEHLREVMRRRGGDRGRLGENGGKEEKSMFELALGNAEETDYHMAFIGVRTAKEYRRTLQDDLKAVKDAQSSKDYSTRLKYYPIHTTTKNDGGWNPKIKPQPHRTGGLLYSHPTMLETYLTTKPQAGIVLQEKYIDRGRFSSVNIGGEDGAKKAFVASFGGLLAEMGVRESANTPPLVSNVNSYAGGSVGEVEKSVAQMRIKTLDVEKPPRVVGKRGQGLKGVGVRASVMVDVPHGERARENAFRPGSWEYVRAERVETKPMRVVNLALSAYGTGRKMYAVKERTEEEKKKGNMRILGVLRNAVKKGNKNGEGEGGPEDL
ncbi:hypothetical protein K443DRAFT_121786 [Laccaria amethystina LaAM-08-1]|uniref:Uncharacterized protein n=1 Tax=Laccaria amethystina LaAM-08-1 TaxID=1095629 RepID=A0A0C9Y3Q8_9AGAR|nr:hypothetical protein K443DRAFT_121786 [Laccaria amethystina LaAM-08-1]